MLSLSPRTDLAKFTFPKDFLPEEIEQKYAKILSRKPMVINTPIDFLNESIRGFSIPGVTDVLITQTQHSTNGGLNRNDKGRGGLGRINVEPKTDISYNGTDNPLDRINKEFKVTFRYNQGFLNYFMLYETLFYRICKHLNRVCDPVFVIDMLSETGSIIGRIKLTDVYMSGIDGIEFDYSKIERNTGATFDVTFKFNNIDYDFGIDHPEQFD